MKWILVLVLAAILAVATVEATPATSSPTKAPTKAPTASPTKAPTKAPTKSPTLLPTSSPTYYCPNSDYNTMAFGVSDIVIMGVSIILTTYAWVKMTYNSRKEPGKAWLRNDGFFDEAGEFLMLFFWSTILKYAVCATFFGLTLYYFFISCSPTEVPRIFNQYSQAGQIAVWVIILGCVMLVTDAAFMGMHAGAFERWANGEDSEYLAVPGSLNKFMGEFRRGLPRFLRGTKLNTSEREEA